MLVSRKTHFVIDFISIQVKDQQKKMAQKSKYNYKTFNDVINCHVHQFFDDQLGNDSYHLTAFPTFYRVAMNRGEMIESIEMREQLLSELNELFPEYNFQIDVTRSTLEIYSCNENCQEVLGSGIFVKVDKDDVVKAGDQADFGEGGDEQWLELGEHIVGKRVSTLHSQRVRRFIDLTLKK